MSPLSALKLLGSTVKDSNYFLECWIQKEVGGGSCKFYRIPRSIYYSWLFQSYSLKHWHRLECFGRLPMGNLTLSYRNRLCRTCMHACTPVRLFIHCHSTVCALTMSDLAFPFLSIKILPYRGAERSRITVKEAYCCVSINEELFNRHAEPKC